MILRVIIWVNLIFDGIRSFTAKYPIVLILDITSDAGCAGAVAALAGARGGIRVGRSGALVEAEAAGVGDGEDVEEARLAGSAVGEGRTDAGVAGAVTGPAGVAELGNRARVRVVLEDLAVAAGRAGRRAGRGRGVQKERRTDRALAGGALRRGVAADALVAARVAGLAVRAVRVELRRTVVDAARGRLAG